MNTVLPASIPATPSKFKIRMWITIGVVAVAMPFAVNATDEDVAPHITAPVTAPVDLDVAWNYAIPAQQGALCSYALDVGSTQAGAYIASYSAVITPELGKAMLLDKCW